MTEYTFDDEGNPVKRLITKYEDEFADEEDVTSPFIIKGDGFDVTLSLANGTITWSNVSPKAKKSKQPIPGTGNCTSGTVTLPLKDVYGVKIKRRPAKGDNEGLCLGFTVYTYYKFGPNIVKDYVIDFEHPSESLCKQYTEGIRKFISDYPGRPHSLKVFMQIHAGTRSSKHIYKNKILPMFLAADASVDCVEIQHAEHVKQEMIHINLDDYDCLVAVGGDGTASKVVAGLLTASQVKKEIEIKPGFTPARAAMPVGIIPTGTTNSIARSVNGLSDPVTAAVYILLGLTTRVDVCSIFHEEKLLQWNFTCQYGFGANVLRYATHYRNSLVPKSIDASIVKAVSKSKLRPYECDIEYIKAEKRPKEQNSVPCRKGCTICWDEKEEEEEEEEQCLVEPFNPLNVSQNSDTSLDLTKDESPWKTIKGSFLQVGVFCIPANSEVAPDGMSPCTHLNDGSIELILVRDTTRKEFVRFLKRHGNAKDQFGFDFVEVIRAKEVKFRPRLPTGFKHVDRKFSEIQYRMSKLERQSSKSEDILEISEDGVRSVLDDMSDIESEDEDLPESSNSDSRKGSGDSTKRPKQYISNNNVIVNTAVQEKNLCGPQYRMTFAEEDKMKRKKRQIKKEEKQKAKEESRLRTIWNLDNEQKNKHELDFRVHHGIVSLCGVGIHPDSTFQEFTCLAIAR